MLFRKSMPTWIGVSLFVVSVAMIPLANRLRPRSADKPRTLAELEASVSRCQPPLNVVYKFEDRPESGMWVCVRPRCREQLWGLCRAPEHAECWQGIVFCERVGNQSLIEEEFIRDKWGEYDLPVGPFVLFGDPKLLQRIREMISGL